MYLYFSHYHNMHGMPMFRYVFSINIGHSIGNKFSIIQWWSECEKPMALCHWDAQCVLTGQWHLTSIMLFTFCKVKVQIVYIPVAMQKLWQHVISTPMLSMRCRIVLCNVYLHHRPLQLRYSNILHHDCSIKIPPLTPTPFLKPKWSHDCHVTQFVTIMFT